MQRTPTFEIVSDVVCPWCFIGKRRLEKALSLLGRSAEIRWEPFQLAPDLPPEGRGRQEYMIEKFGSKERVEEVEEYVRSIGKEEGIELKVDEIPRSPNTLLAHTLLTASASHPQHNDVSEQLFKAYFQEGRDIGNPEVVKSIGLEAGLPEEVVSNAITDLDLRRATQKRALAWREKGVTVVPTFLLNGKLLCEGAEEVEWFVERLRAVTDEEDL